MRLVVGLDLSARDEAILTWTSTFAARVEVSVVVVHVVPRTTLWVVSSVQADSEAYLATIHTRLEREAVPQLRERGVDVALRVTRGDPAHELAHIAHQTGADLIVIGGPDHSTLHDVISVGIAHKLQRCSDVPTVTVPHAKQPANES